MALKDYSTTPANNNSAPPNGAPEGMAPSAVNDVIRQVMADVRTEYNLTIPALIPGGRLTLTTGVPVTTADVSGAEAIYYAPYIHDKIVLFDGTNWRQYTFTERTIDVPDATNMYDVFIYDNAGSITLELTAWTNETTRATALTMQDGVLVKTGALTRRYLGSFYCTTAGNGQTEDSKAKRYLWNYYNRVRREMRNATETTDSWNYTTAAFRQANTNTANQLDFAIGVSESIVSAQVHSSVSNNLAGGTVTPAVGIGVDSTTVSGSASTMLNTCTVANCLVPQSAEYRGLPGVGRHFLAWLEYSPATGVTTWYGDSGVPDRLQSGIFGEVWA